MELFPDSYPDQIHLIGICGVAMASAAVEMHRAGVRVTGSDSAFYPPMSALIEAEGIECRSGYKPSNLPESGIVVVGNAISRGNPELEAALSRNIPLISLPELISHRYLRGKRPIVAAGTHGKSTTTAMVAHILRQAKRDPGWLIGALPLGLDLPCHAGQGDEFVIEGDEYDCAWFDKRPKFLHYWPFAGIINAIEFDHSDIYNDLAEIKLMFSRFAGMIPENGCLIVNGDEADCLEVAESACCGVRTFGASDSCDWQLLEVSFESEYTSGKFSCPDDGLYTVDLPVPGEFNLRNALAAIAACEFVGVKIEAACSALKSFQGLERRQQLVIESNGIMLWDDFAHHPTAVAGILTALKQRFPDRRLVALFEPRSNTMVRRFFQSELTEALKVANWAILGPLHRKEKIPESERLDSGLVITELKKAGVGAVATESFDEAFDAVAGEMSAGDVVVIMSNGSFGGLKDRLVEHIVNQVKMGG